RNTGFRCRLQDRDSSRAPIRPNPGPHSPGYAARLALNAPEAPMAPPIQLVDVSTHVWLCGSDRRAGRRRRGARRRRVLEFLFLAEDRVEHLRAELLAAGEREPEPEREDHELATEPATLLRLLLRALGQRGRRITQRLDRLLEVTLELLVLEQRLGRGLAVGQAGVRAPARVVSGPDVVPQLSVLDDPPDVRRRLAD